MEKGKRLKRVLKKVIPALMAALLVLLEFQSRIAVYGSAPDLLKEDEPVYFDAEEPSVFFDADPADEESYEYITDEDSLADSDAAYFFPEGTAEDESPDAEAVTGEESGGWAYEDDGYTYEAQSTEPSGDTDAIYEDTWSVAEEPYVDSETAEAEDPVLLSSAVNIIDLNSISPFASRTASEVRNRYSSAHNAGASYINGSPSSYYSSPCSDSYPYKEGRLAADTVKTMHAMTNFYRWLSGAAVLTRDSTTLAVLQKAALVRMFSYGITVSGKGPANFDSALWNEGASAHIDVLTHHQTPENSIRKILNSGYNRNVGYWYSMSGRDVLLDPALSWISFGYSGDVAVGYARAYDNTVSSYTAFPAPGYMPSEALDPGMSAWSLEIGNEEIDLSNGAAIRVRVENIDTGGNYVCSSANGKLIIDGRRIAFVQPSADDYAGKNYRITVSGLRNAGGGDVRVSYEIYFRSMIPDIESGISGVTFDYSDLIIRKDTSDAASLKKIAAVLPRTCDVSAESGAVFTIPVKGAWTVDQKAKCFRARADASKLPSNLSDPSGFLGSLKIPYVVKDTNDTRNSILSFSPNPAVNGDALRIGVTRCDLVYNRSRIYRITGSGAVLFADSDTSESFIKSTYSREEHVFKITDISRSLAGEYIGIYHYRQFKDTAYVTQIETLAFKKPSVKYSVYLHGSGWSDTMAQGASAGCTNYARRIDAFRISIDGDSQLKIRYSLARNGGGWSGFRANGAVLGTSRAGYKAAEALRISLTGDAASEYDLYYCVYAKGYGWLGWTKNGKPAGTRGKSSDLRALKIRLVKKGSAAPKRIGTISKSYLYQ